MANKKINELSVRTPSLSDLMLVGDPSTGYSYKATISSLSTLLEANIALNDLSDVVITSVANGNLLAYNGTNWVNRTLGAYLGGTITQYVRGDGSLGDFAGGGGGGGASVSYYLNGSVNQGTFSGTTYYEMNKTPVAGAGTNFTINANGYIASFITDANDPALLKIPGGNWNLEFYFSASSAGGTPSFYVELYKYDGTTFTLIASNSATPEGITNGTVNDAYFTALAVPETVLTLTDRLAIRVYVTHSGRTITLHTENSNLCQIITTFTTGLTALNNLTAQVQFFATGTSGTDFAISSTTATHTFNLPTASGTNRGALSSADWTTFNGKVGGSGTTNYVSKFTASGTIGNSQIFDDGTNVGVGTASPSSTLELYKATGPNYLYVTNGTSGTNNGVVLRYNSVDYMGMIGTFTSGELKIGGFNSGGYFMTFYSNNAERMRLTPSGRLLIGTSTESTYILDANGTVRVQGTELRLDNGTTGTINLYSATPTINFFSGGGYTFGRSSTTMTWNSGGTIAIQISGNNGYSLDASNGHVWKTALSGGSNTARLTTGGNLIVGGTTDAGYRLDVNGTLRSTQGASFATSSGNVGILTTSPTNLLTLVGSTTGRGIDFVSQANFALVTGKINYETTNDLFSIINASSWGNSALIFGTNNTERARITQSGTLAIGTTSPNASALLDITSTTKGFLPPRMTGAQAEAIGTPAAGLMVYSTDGSGATITSLGWWGYNGTTWVKLN